MAIRIQAVWAARRDGERNIGFGVEPVRFYGALGAAAACFVMAIVLLMLGSAVLSVLVSIVGAVVGSRAGGGEGGNYCYYEIDREARPVRLLGGAPPPEIAKRRPTSRRRFAQATGA